MKSSENPAPPEKATKELPEEASLQRLEQINRVLGAVRAVNQLITREHHRDTILERACRIVVEHCGFHNAWIALTDPESGKLVKTFHAGFDDTFAAMEKLLQKNSLTHCMRKALQATDPVVILNPPSECTDCPLAGFYDDRSGLACRLECKGRIYGWIAVSVATRFAQNPKEIGLFKELAGDLAFALAKLESDKKLEQTNRELEEARQAALNMMEDALLARETIAATEARLQITLDSIGDAVMAMGTDHRITLMNPVAEQLTGWSAEEADGHPFSEVFKIINEDTRLPVENPAEKVLADGHIIGLANHTLLIARDGREIAIADSAAPIRNTAGEIVGVVLVFRDQTLERAARRALEESESRYRQLFENMTTGFALHEMIYNEAGEAVDYRFLAVNPAFERLTGLKAENLIGHTVKGALPRTEPHWIDRYAVVVETGEPAEFDEYSCELDRFFEVKAFRPEPGRFAVVFTDITRQKKTERELKERLYELERFNKAATGRELRMIELKEEINRLSKQLGQQTPYPAVEQRNKPKRKRWFRR